MVVLLATGVVVVSILLAPGRGVLWQARAARRARAGISDRRVLAALQTLAQSHADSAYPAERGMIGTALGAQPTPAQLADLERRGLIRPVPHPPETTPHWALTPTGHAAARGRAGPEDTP